MTLPAGLRWHVDPESWHVEGDRLVVGAAAATDSFIDPAGTVTVVNGARALLEPPPGTWQLTACVEPAFFATYDAGGLLLWADDRHFAKLCFEQSPQGAAMVVSVVTRGDSDDANGWIVPHASLWLRVSRVGGSGAYAFHAREEAGDDWALVRYFSLAGERPITCGILAQSPVGTGCVVSFTNITFNRTELRDPRDGS